MREKKQNKTKKTPILRKQP